MPTQPKPKTLWKHWDTVEKKIKEEMIWLENNIETFSNIAILIVSGQVKATEITKTPPLKSFWINKKVKKKNRAQKRHGSDWHKEMMAKIENHFLRLGYEIVCEPDLNQGRAGLGVYKKGKKDLFIEVGTTSFF